MKTWMMPDVQRYSRMTTDELRSTFLVENLFKKGEIVANYIDLDRTIVGSAVPGGGGENHALVLATADELRAAYFLERRELGILNIGSKGTVIVDGKPYEMDNLDCMYVGRGSREVRFMSHEAHGGGSAGGEGGGAQFYLLSYPAHTLYPTTLAKKSQAAAVPLGKQESLNKRTIYKYIHMDGIKSCQLVMGFTELEVGSGWNTMPPHTHLRRSEVYLYFNLAQTARVFHLMGTPQETRHLVVADKQLVISPSWSIHAGIGTTHYTFCWGMGGENQAFDDMDAVPVPSLR